MLLILAVGIIPIVLLHIFISGSYESAMLKQKKSEVSQHLHAIAADFSDYDDVEKALTEEKVTALIWQSESIDGRMLMIDKNFKVLCDTYNVDEGKTVVSDSVFKALNGTENATYNKKSEYLEFVIPVRSEEQISAVLVGSSSAEGLHASFRKVNEALLIIELILLLILIFVAIYGSHLLTAPIKKVSYEMKKFHSGHMDGESPEFHSYKEVDEILESADNIIEQYKKMEENQEEFVSNVSHELRTPLTSVKVLSDSLIGQENIPEETYQEFLSDISQEIDRESRIIDDLLSMTRYTGTENVLNITTVDVNAFIMSILKTLKPIAIEQDVELIYESFRQIKADFDELKLGQAFTNLIENSIKYNKEGGNVKVSLDADHEYFFLRVQDNGVGIPESSLPHIFDRFYRVDKARSRETGGTGLGLSITKQLILLHDGAIKVESKLNEGSTFTVRIPLKHVDKGGAKS